MPNQYNQNVPFGYGAPQTQPAPQGQPYGAPAGVQTQQYAAPAQPTQPYGAQAQPAQPYNPYNNAPAQPYGAQGQPYGAQPAPAHKEGDVRWIDNNHNNRVRLTGHIMSCTRIVQAQGKTTIVALQLSVPHDKNDTFNIVTLIGNVADRALKYLSIGDKITVNGEIRVDSFTPEGSNDKVYSTSIIVSNFEFAESQAGKEFRHWRKTMTAQANGQPAPIIETIADNFYRRQQMKQQNQGYRN